MREMSVFYLDLLRWMGTVDLLRVARLGQLAGQCKLQGGLKEALPMEAYYKNIKKKHKK
jgi:hypothetical protein